VPSSHLKRPERATAAIRDQRELPPETVQALEEIVGAIRSLEGRLALREGKGISISPPTAPNGIHLLDHHGHHATHILALLGEPTAV
jgi:hypothetical protein